MLAVKLFKWVFCLVQGERNSCEGYTRFLFFTFNRVSPHWIAINNYLLNQNFLSLFTFTFSPFLQILEMEILMDWHVIKSPESENRNFSVWFVWLLQKHPIGYSTLASYTDATWNFLWRSDKNFVCTSNTFRPMEGISCHWIFVLHST